MKGVKFGDKHTYQEWNLILTKTTIDFPSTKKEELDILGADGKLDFSESLTGDIKYENRKITFEFTTTEKYESWKSLNSKIANYLHGQKLKIILDEDPNFYYFGRVEINQFKSDKSLGVIQIDCDVEPYKYDLYSSIEDWEWDSFDFEQGIINEMNEIIVNGEAKVNIIGRRQKVVPKFTCENPITVIFNSKEYNLLSGTQKVLNIQICNGENEIILKGNGKVRIDYRGGSL